MTTFYATSLDYRRNIMSHKVSICLPTRVRSMDKLCHVARLVHRHLLFSSKNNDISVIRIKTKRTKKEQGTKKRGK